MNQNMLKDIKDVVQDCNINFLIGSGLSSPYLELLGNIEALLTELESGPLADEEKKLVRVSLYKRYFDGVISKNISILNDNADADSILSQYKDFLKSLNRILLKRKSTILAKQINLFTTNIDIFLEKALERTGMEWNDGFNGRFRPVFSLSNFKKALFKKSLHYDNTSELPVFNLLKLHGSLTWKLESPHGISFSYDLELVRNIGGLVLPAGQLLDIREGDTIEMLIEQCKGKECGPSFAKFLDSYEKLLIVNPTKEKFKQTVLQQTYYEMLRIYANELEKENTVLFVMGFSFADEHIREITVRAANSNPTLIIYVISYDKAAKEEIESRLGMGTIKNDNIKFEGPAQGDEEQGTLRGRLSRTRGLEWPLFLQGTCPSCS